MNSAWAAVAAYGRDDAVFSSAAGMAGFAVRGGDITLSREWGHSVCQQVGGLIVFTTDGVWSATPELSQLELGGVAVTCRPRQSAGNLELASSSILPRSGISARPKQVDPRFLVDSALWVRDT